MVLSSHVGTLPIVVDMNQVPKFDTQEDESPPPLPARIANTSHTVQADSQGQKPRAAPSEMSAPALPPKPQRKKLVSKIKCPLMIKTGAHS